MPKLNIFDRKGKKVGTYNVEPTDFAPRINKQLLHDAVVMYQANERQGSHQTKSRGMVAGSTKKMYRQKGTGNARAGSKRSGIRRGGGHIFAKVNRDYGYRLPRKALQTATRMALAAKVRDEELVIIDDLSFAEPKTKDMVSVIKHVGCDGGSLLVTTAGYDAQRLSQCPQPGRGVGGAGERDQCLQRAAFAASAGDEGRARCPGGFGQVAVAAGDAANGEAPAKPARTKRVTTKSSTPRRATKKKAAE